MIQSASLDQIQPVSIKLLTRPKSIIQSRQIRLRAARLWYSERVDEEAALLRSMADNPSPFFVERRARESSYYRTYCRLRCGQRVNIKEVVRSSRERTTQQGSNTSPECNESTLKPAGNCGVKDFWSCGGVEAGLCRLRRIS